MIKYEYMTKLSYEKACKQTECNKKDTIIAYYYGHGIEARYRGKDRMFFLYRIMEDKP